MTALKLSLLSLGGLAFAVTASVGCRSSQPYSPPTTAPKADEVARGSAPPCEEGRIAAKLIVLSVDSMDDAAARRVEAMLSDKFSAGIVSATANPSTKLVAMLARAEAEITVATTIDLLQELGLQAREADENAYEVAASELGARTLATAANDSLPDGGAPESLMQSLEASLTPLRTRFNSDKGMLRFIALLSPT